MMPFSVDFPSIWNLDLMPKWWDNIVLELGPHFNNLWFSDYVVHSFISFSIDTAFNPSSGPTSEHTKDIYGMKRSTYWPITP